MENATKALLIAAAVLIAILLISLSVGVFNKSSDQVSNADLSQYEAQKFNEQFTKFAGENKSGAEVNALIQAVVTSNNAPNQTNMVEVDGNAGIAIDDIPVNNYPAKVATGGRYDVSIAMTNGLVDVITIDNH